MSVGHKSKIADQTLPSLILITFSSALFFPTLNPASGFSLFRLTSTAIVLGLVLIFLTFQNRIQKSVVKPLLMLSIYPLYLSAHTIVEGTFSIALLGTADRNLGVFTSLVCLGFFIFGQSVFSKSKGSFIQIIIGLEIIQLIVFATKYFGLASDGRLGSFYNSNPTSILFGLTSIIIIINFWESKRANSRHIINTLILFLISACILIWIGSVQAYVGFLGSFFLYCLKFIYKQRNELARIQLAAILMGYTAFIGFFLRSKPPTPIQANGNSFYERLEIYKTSIKIIRENPLFGIGVDNFNLGYYKYNYTSNLKLVDNAHSIPLQIAGTVGIIGLLIWGFILLKMTYTASVNTDFKDSHLLAGIHFYLISGCFAIQVPGIEFLLFFILGYTYKANISSRNFASRGKPLAVIIAVTAILSVAVSSKAFLTHLQFSRAITLPLYSSVKDLQVLEGDADYLFDIGLLFRAGQRAIALKDKSLGLHILQEMMTKWPLDQRTVAYALILGATFSDEKITRLGEQLNAKAKAQD